ncbi:hypothetical protein [Nocardia sp. alder85J]|uniref:hypothetical protein n=1 Tax=Nocardia sp. alder85J TaxID=2862949 RepID=UPI001CD7F591|nr:hypothetical protein [Nocardia sp. alder85J]MCX4096261.1 hypothetical protein [Nocardia sp. alder85J]
MTRLNLGLGAVAATAAACLIAGGIIQTAHADPVMGDSCNPAVDHHFVTPEGSLLSCSEFPNVGTVWAETHTLTTPPVSRGTSCTVDQPNVALDPQNRIMTCIDDRGDGRTTWQPAEQQ